MSTKNLTVAETIKELLSDPRNRIRLDDFVTNHIKHFIEATSITHFPIQGSNIQPEEFPERLHKYEKVVEDMQQIVILLARWGDQEHLLLLEKIFLRITEVDRGSSGLVQWQKLSWYPVLLLMYSAGIAALTAKKYEVLKIVFDTQVTENINSTQRLPLITRAVTNLADLNDSFRSLPGLERHYTAKSDYLAALLKDKLEEILFLGGGYDHTFDMFEVYLGLVSSHESAHGWGPVGRFAWKYNYDEDSNPFHLISKEAEISAENWMPIKVGLFGGSIDKFQATYATFKKDYFERNRTLMS